MRDSRGFFIFVQHSEMKDYINQAVSLAKTIQLHNKINKVSIMTNCILTEEQKTCFDKIYNIPGIDEAESHKWKIHNRHKIYATSPYDETIVLDSDMLFLSNIDHWWDILHKTDLYFTDSVVNFLGETVNDTFYRKTFVKNKLPNVYCGMFYFKKNNFNEKFFNLLTHVMHNYEEYAHRYCRAHIQSWCSLDVSTAIVCKMMGVKNKIKYKELTFTHMKSNLQNWNVEENWLKEIPVSFDEHLNIKINSVRQQGLLHYVQDNFLNQELQQLIDRLWKEKTSSLA